MIPRPELRGSFARWSVVAVAALSITACTPGRMALAGPGAPAPTAPDPGAIRWVVASRPGVDLWYHGLAYLGIGATPSMPIYRQEYVASMEEMKRVAGVHPTVLDRRKEELALLLGAGPRTTALQFLPLYFDDGALFFEALQAWIQADGNPGRVRDPNLSNAVSFISRQLPSLEERRAVASFVEVLREEDRVFYSAYRERIGARYATVADSVQAQWDRLAPRLETVLDYLLLNQGQIILSLPLGHEGRTVSVDRQSNRVAVQMPEPGRADDAVWAAVQEMMYPFVEAVVTDNVAPAALRGMDVQSLNRHAAVRAGALLLELHYPEAAASYRAAHLRWAGRPASGAAEQVRRIFDEAFPLPEPLPAALAQGVQDISRGF